MLTRADPVQLRGNRPLMLSRLFRPCIAAWLRSATVVTEGDCAQRVQRL